MSKTDKKAFNYEKGQFICHIYAPLQTEERPILEDVIQIIQDEQSDDVKSNQSVHGWKPLIKNNEKEPDFHITLLRGHRSIHYHQIRALLESLGSECKIIPPFCICLDELKVFQNYERNKEFLCLAARREIPEFVDLKRKLQDRVDRFSLRLTDEDESQDTLAHCSLMFRESAENIEPNELNSISGDLSTLCLSSFGELPICLVQVRAIRLKIGNHIYKLNLEG